MLFKIVSAEIKRTGLKIRGYVDDGLLTSVATTENEKVVRPQKVLAMAKEWVYKNGLSFDLGKFEAVHFSRKHKLPNPPIQLHISQKTDLVVTPVHKSNALRWLRVYFDVRPSFVNHAEKMAARDRLAATGLHMLTQTTGGVEAEIMRRDVHACIFPILTYDAPAWWPGKTQINRAGSTIQNGVEKHCKRLNLTQNVALRAILPFWGTTPVAILQSEAVIPPIHHILNYLCPFASLRSYRLELKHLLHPRSKDKPQGKSPTRLERLAKLCKPEVKFSNPLAAAEPWKTNVLGLQSYLDAAGGIANKMYQRKMSRNGSRKWIC